MRAGTTPRFVVTVNRPGVAAIHYADTYSTSRGSAGCSATARTQVGDVTL